MFKTVVLGGTFDGIHSGHKLLFEEAIRLCMKRLIVGVTDMEMNKSKVLWELIAPTVERIESVDKYLKSVNPSLKYDIVPITDLYGPTIVEEDLDCIVVSNETRRGADKINEARSAKGWRSLKIHTIDLLPENSISFKTAMDALSEKKVSSSLRRLEKLGTILNEPKPNPNIPSRPYMIGLTGGIASGKTAIGQYLESIGFGYINYDILGHKTYAQVGCPIYNEIVQYFGRSVVDKETENIDRRALGRVVFNDKAKLDKLNEIVWPGIYRLVDAEIEKLKPDREVIVLESALLVESKQDSRVHQIWTTIVPPEEAIKRQMDCRGLTREEAERRVNSQTDNLTRVKSSNVVFCSLWKPEFTLQQVKRCVDILRSKYLNKT